MTLPSDIMIVEDEVITQRYLQTIFSQHNIESIKCFDNALDVLESLKTVSCSMILMDINIKGATDGIQLARQIVHHYNIPIIFITAHNDDDTLDELLELAPYGFITKPFSSKEVLVAVQVAYKRHLVDKNKVNKSSEELSVIQINENLIYFEKLRELHCEGETVKLNANQSKLLEILVEHKSHIVEYDTLIYFIWKEVPIADSALRTLVYSLRKLLPRLPIVSHSKMGYSLRVSLGT